MVLRSWMFVRLRDGRARPGTSQQVWCARRSGEEKGVRNEWHLIDRKPYDSPGLYWSLGLVIGVYDFGLRLTTRGSYLLLPNRGSHLLPRRWMRYALLG
jgi:hypothetical protein